MLTPCLPTPPAPPPADPGAAVELAISEFQETMNKSGNHIKDMAASNSASAAKFGQQFDSLDQQLKTSLKSIQQLEASFYKSAHKLRVR